MSNETSFDSGFRKQISGFVVTPKFLETEVVVSMNSPVLQGYSTGLFELLNLDTNVMSITYDELHWYLTWLIGNRVAYVRGHRLAFLLKETTLTIPADLNQVLLGMGDVTSEEFGVVLKLSFPSNNVIVTKKRKVKDKDGKEVDEEYKVEYPHHEYYTLQETYSTAKQISNKLRAQMRAAGLSYSEELPRSRKGNYDFMTFQVIKDEVVNESTKPAPYVAMLASFISLKQRTDLIMNRVSYGTVGNLSRMIQEVFKYEKRNHS